MQIFLCAVRFQQISIVVHAFADIVECQKNRHFCKSLQVFIKPPDLLLHGGAPLIKPHHMSEIRLFIHRFPADIAKRPVHKTEKSASIPLVFRCLRKLQISKQITYHLGIIDAFYLFSETAGYARLPAFFC